MPLTPIPENLWSGTALRSVGDGNDLELVAG